MANLVDPNAVMHVLGCLMEDPRILRTVDKYHLEKEDFVDKFTRNIFTKEHL